MNKSESKYYNTALLMDEALLLLLEKKEFEYITVKEICDKAGVNRSTFYLHYENTNDLLGEVITLINKRFFESFQNRNINITKASKEESFFITKEYLIPYLKFVKDNKRVFRLIHDKPHLFGNEKALKGMYEGLFSLILDKFNVVEEDKKYIFAYFTQGTLAVILKWVECDCRDDIEKIANLIINLISYVKADK